MVHDHSLSTSRIESFSDGVFGVVATLLVLNIKISDIIKNPTTQIGLKELAPVLPQIIGFGLSFFTICVFWVNHHEFFHALKKVDTTLLWLNNLLLFWLCFVPFPTSFVGTYPSSKTAAIFYGSVLFMASLSFSLMRYYAFIRSDLHHDHITLEERKRSFRWTYWGLSLWSLSIVGAFISVYISLTIFVLVPLIYLFPRKVRFV